MNISTKFTLGLFLLVLAMLVVVNCSGDATQAAGSSPKNDSNAEQPQHGGEPASIQHTVIAYENAKPGTDAWKLVNPAIAHEIEGYASLNSVNKGKAIDFHINTTAPSYNIDIYRMGYYAGAGARLMKSIEKLPRQPQLTPCLNEKGVIECNWLVSISLDIPAGETDPVAMNYWASGIYLAKLTTNSKPVKDSYIIFVVRDDDRPATYISQLPVTTYQAYNFWGGKSLYTGCETHPQGWKCADGQLPAVAVSFNRPYGRGATAASAAGVGAGEFLTNVQAVRSEYNISNAGWDYNMVRWMERQGYDLKYITNLDLHENPLVLQQAKAFISTGHDEYYSKPMWDRLIDARSAGINLAFFSANQIYWQVRFNDGSYGTSVKNRIMICYRGGGDPVTDNSLTTDQFRYLGRPEAALIGNQYVKDPVVGDVTLTNTGHWLFAETGASNETVLKGVLGYEINAHVPGISPAQTKILAHSVSGNYASDITYYVDRSAAQVFATGTMQWAWGLDDFRLNNLRDDYTDPVAQAFTANLFKAVGEKDLAILTLSNAKLDLSTPYHNLDGAHVIVNPAPEDNAKTNQWRLIRTGTSSYYYLVSRANGLCLQPIGNNLGAEAGTRDCTGADNQQWLLVSTDRGMSIIGKSTDACLNVPATSAGSKVTVDQCNSQPNQYWDRLAVR